MPELTLPDGRRLTYALMGDPSGHPVILLHGSPGSARQLAGLDRLGRDQGISIVAPDRAGYGGSTYDPGRTIGSGARDVGELVRRLRFERCAVVGLSGGGPTALACGVLLPELVPGRVHAVATVGGVAPLVPRNPQLPADRIVIRTARRSQLAARALFALVVQAGRARPAETLDRFAALLAEPDARLLRDDDRVRNGFLDDLRHPSTTAARAAARDFWLFARRWDVDLSDMAVPAHIWHGTADRNVPVAHARVIAVSCPTADPYIVDGGGHMLLSRFEQIVAGLRAA